MNRCVLVCGADIADYSRAQSLLRPDDFMVYCDSGLRHEAGLHRKPDLIVGDFDSHDDPHLPVETIRLPREKDDTDSVYAAKEMLRRGYRDFLLLGAVGGRLDHSLVNVSLLSWLKESGAKASLLDDYSIMEIITPGEIHTISDSFAYFSLLTLGGEAKGVTIRNAKFPLENGAITPRYQYATSNEVLPGREATVSLTAGELLLIKIF